MCCSIILSSARPFCILTHVHVYTHVYPTGISGRPPRGMYRRMLSEPDEALNRAMTSSQNFDDSVESNLSSLSLSRADSYPNGTAHPSGIIRQPSTTAPQTGKKRYILQLPQKNLNRHFTHIFFRKSGIFLITVSLVDLMGGGAMRMHASVY